MRLLLDTSAYSAMRRGDERLRPFVREAEEIHLSTIVLGELLSGFAGGRQEAQNRRLLREFIDSPRVGVLGLDYETAERYAQIRHELKQRGRPIPANDIWIAASAAQHGLRLLTLDEHFTHLPQILVEYLEPTQ